jgi:O-antigen/teichoic acid export membrane protein
VERAEGDPWMNIHSLFKNMSAFIFSNITGMLISFITGIYLARILGAVSYGQISFAIAITTLFYYMTDFGTNMYSTTQVSSGKENLLTAIETIYPLKAALAMIGFIIICIIAFIAVPKNNQLLVILYGASVFPVAMGLDWIFQATGMTKYLGISKLLYTGSMFIMVFLFVTSPEKIILVPIFQFAGLLLGIISLLLVFRKLHYHPMFKFEISKWPMVLKKSFPFGITGVMTMVAWYVPFIILQYISGNEMLGYFTAADTLISALIAIYGWYFYCIYPVFVQSIHNAQMIQNYSARFVFGTITPICIGGCLLSNQIISFIYGDAFTLASPLLILMLISLWFLEWNQIYIFGIFSIGKQTITTRIFAIQCIGTIILSFMLIPLFGAVGAALAAIGCEIIALPLFYWEFRKFININYFWILSRSGSASIIMAGVIIALQHYIIDNIALSIIAGGISFIIIAYFMDVITMDDISKIIHGGINV